MRRGEGEEVKEEEEKNKEILNAECYDLHLITSQERFQRWRVNRKHSLNERLIRENSDFLIFKCALGLYIRLDISKFESFINNNQI